MKTKLFEIPRKETKVYFLINGKRYSDAAVYSYKRNLIYPHGRLLERYLLGYPTETIWSYVIYTKEKALEAINEYRAHFMKMEYSLHVHNQLQK